MKRSVVRIAMLVTFLLVASLVCGTISALAADNSTVNLELTDVDARAAIKMLFQSTGKNYAIDSDVTGTIPSVVLRDLPFEQALRSLLRSAGLVHRMDGEVYIITKKPEVVNPAVAAAAPGTEVIAEETATEETTIEKIPLNNVGASEILGMISGSGSTGSSMFGSNLGNSFGSNFGSSNFGSSNFGSSNFGSSNIGGSSSWSNRGSSSSRTSSLGSSRMSNW